MKTEVVSQRMVTDVQLVTMDTSNGQSQYLLTSQCLKASL